MNAGRVVVVDDSGINRMLLGGILEDAGYEVRSAASGTEALKMVDQEIPDLILLDIQMPDMNGYEVCKRLKASSRTVGIPVIFVSALDDVFDKVAAFEAGGVDYLTKPIEAAEVLARVDNQVKIFRLQRELRQRNAELQRRNEQLIDAKNRTEKVFVALAEALPGTVLDETYRLDTKIGEGGFGAVYRGVHLKLQRPVAVKVLRPVSGSDTVEELLRFRREGIAACRISHPHAVDVLDFGVSSSGIAYLVMELLRGKTVATLVRDHGPLSLRRSAEIIQPVCDVLMAAHTAGIIHRDIKPDNIFLHETPAGEIVKVVDFGIAKLMDDVNDPDVGLVTRRGTLVGTPEFMAPERILGPSYDERSDIYSLGVTLYFMLTGEMPYELEGWANVPEMVKLHLTSKPRHIRELNREIPELVAEVLMQALEVEPVKRPTMAAIAGSLKSSASAR